MHAINVDPDALPVMAQDSESVARSLALRAPELEFIAAILRAHVLQGKGEKIPILPAQNPGVPSYTSLTIDWYVESNNFLKYRDIPLSLRNQA